MEKVLWRENDKGKVKKKQKTGECGSESCDGESEETELKQMGGSDKGGELSVVSHFEVRELTVNHWGIVNQLCIISGSAASKNVSLHSSFGTFVN